MDVVLDACLISSGVFFLSDEGSQWYSYADLGSGLITTYAISTGENWPQILQLVDGITTNWWLLTQLVTYMAVLVIFGAFLIPALFLSVCPVRGLCFLGSTASLFSSSCSAGHWRDCRGCDGLCM